MLSDHPHSRLSTSLTVFFTIKCTKNIASKSIEQWSFFFLGETTLFIQSITNQRCSQNMTKSKDSTFLNHDKELIRLCLKDWSRHHSFTFLHPYISTNIQIVIQLNAHLHNSLFFGNTKQMMHTAAQKTLSKVACCIIFSHIQKIFLAHVSYILFNRKKCLISIVPLTSYQYCSQQYGNP